METAGSLASEFVTPARGHCSRQSEVGPMKPILCLLLLLASCLSVLAQETDGPTLAVRTGTAAPGESAAGSTGITIDKPDVGPRAGTDKGVFGRIVFGTGHDSLLGYSGDLELSLGYDFSHTLQLEGGVPIYWLSIAPKTVPAGTTTQTNRYGSFGDGFFKLEFAPDIDVLDYTLDVTTTVPTGASVVSAGRGTWDLNNRLEHEFRKPFNPYLELILGNVLPATTRLAQASTISGAEFQARLGNTFKLPHSLAFETAFYEAAPLTGKAEGAALVPSGRTIQLADHGFLGSILLSHARWQVDITYTRSIPNHLDGLWGTLGYRLGHLRKSENE